MKKLLWVGALLVAVGFLPGRARADGWGLPPVHVDAGIKARFNVHVLDWSCMANLGPWYQYYPYEAHFQMPAPYGHYPNWPPRMITPAPHDPHAQAPFPVMPQAQMPFPVVPQAPFAGTQGQMPFPVMQQAPFAGPQMPQVQQPNPNVNAPAGPELPPQGPPLSYLNQQASGYQPVGYYYPAPAYWYGR